MLNEYWQGAFDRDEFLRLALPRRVSLVLVYAFLTRELSRRPSCLAWHVLRIVAAQFDPEALYAALLDLFWVLQGKGERLRRRVLGWAGKRLAPDRLAVLEQCLAGEIDVRRLPFSPRSVLHDGAWGQVVDLPVAQANETKLDPLIVAQRCLELGQLDQAREILVAQLAVEPQRSELRQALLEIYLATQDGDGFWQSYRQLLTLGCLDNHWRSASARFGA